MDIDKRIEELKLELPKPPSVGGHYHMTVLEGDLLYVSGHVSTNADGSFFAGKLGDTLTTEQGYEAAKRVALNMLATLKSELGSLDRVVKLVKAFGMVNSAYDFIEQPKVMNGFSETIASVFGQENGKGARSAVGMMLPNNVAVEVEAIFKVKI
ncbi:MAG: RidA family protein [Cyclobacteriaceae bacterium]|nr:RidA family protein [Cyclobacteriaceae bacterium]